MYTVSANAREGSGMSRVANAQEPLLTVGEVAKQLRQHPATIYRKVHDGELLAYRLGELGPLRIPADALAQHLVPANVEERR